MGMKEWKDGKIVKQWNTDFTDKSPPQSAILNRTTQGILLVAASSTLLLNNWGGPLGMIASGLFLLANALGLYLHLKKSK